MKDVEKFKELLKELIHITTECSNLMEIAYNDSHEKRMEELDKKDEEIQNELIQMYSELEEPQEKPVIKCKEEIKIYYTGIGYFEVTYEASNFTQCYYTKICEEKENMLITDDFIFIKE